MYKTKNCYLCTAFARKRFWKLECTYQAKVNFKNAKIAQLVEHDLAKVGVAGSSPVFRSLNNPLPRGFFSLNDFGLPGWWNW